MSSTDHRGRPRVAITGMGIKSPAGLTVESFWETILSGRSLAAPITLFDTSAHSIDFACEVRDFDAEPYIGPKEVRRTDRATLLGLTAATDAIRQAQGAKADAVDQAQDAEGTVGLEDADGGDDGLNAPSHRRGVVAGSGVGGIRTLEDQVIQYADRGPSRVSPFLVPMMMANATSAMVGIHHRWAGPNLAVATACATGTNAIGEGARMIRDGMADVVVCGGTEASVAPVSMAAFSRMGALSRNANPAAASRPFDVDRDGFVMGEGAAFMVLESQDHALERGATVLGEILGYAMTCDAHHITAPLDDGAGAAACMSLALDDAGLQPADIGHVNAHGTSTPHNDSAEAAAVAKVFGEGSVPITSLKGAVGHLIGAAGAVEAVAAVLAAEQGIIPPTANHEQCDLPVDVVAGQPRTARPAPVLSASYAFGGHNAALVVGPAER